MSAYVTAVAGTPSGLDVSGQSSSPYDLALVMRHIVEDPELLAIMQTPHTGDARRAAALPGVPDPESEPAPVDVPGLLAGKNGFTDAARYTYVGAPSRMVAGSW